MTLLHSLVDGLKIKKRCHQKEGVTLRPPYLKKHFVEEMDDNLCSKLGFIQVTYNYTRLIFI